MLNTKALKLNRNHMFSYQIAILFLVEMKSLSDLSSKHKNAQTNKTNTPDSLWSLTPQNIDV